MELSIEESAHEASLVDVAAAEDLRLPKEEGMFIDKEHALMHEDGHDVEGRDLNEYYDNRAYAGAPPAIPHPLLSEKGIGGKSCLQCHENGGFVKQFKAFAPVTPHPEFISCKQCHVPQKTARLFKGSEFPKLIKPEIHQSALEGSPPVIPHSLDLRQNCLACHAGPAAVKEIRVTHPERTNCRQCHVPANQGETNFWSQLKGKKKSTENKPTE